MKVLSNVEACVLVGGCVLAVDLLTAAHEASERTSIPLQSNLIAATAFMEPLKEWMLIDKDGVQVGPVEKDAVRRFWSKKTIDWTTRCWASGMLDWKRLRDIRELRWALAVRVPVLTPTQVFFSLSYKFSYVALSYMHGHILLGLVAVYSYLSAYLVRVQALLCCSLSGCLHSNCGLLLSLR